MLRLQIVAVTLLVSEAAATFSFLPSSGKSRYETFSDLIRFPGTKWCGPGGAEDYDDLGRSTETDKCCRSHDNCDHILAGRQKYGLENMSLITKLDCQCDKEFWDCLNRVGGLRAETIGRMYFRLQRQCYRKAPPIIGCRKYRERFLAPDRCINYVYDTTEPECYQWFDLPRYDDKKAAYESDAFKDILLLDIRT